MTERTVIETIDAARAAKLLATVNKDKIRNIRKPKVDQYARDMLSGHWTVHAPIIINELGVMVDGNHRMRALVLAANEGAGTYEAQPELALRFSMLYDFPASMEVEDTIDTGMPRKYGDVLAIRGVANATLVASLARKLMSWDQGIYYTGGGSVGRSRTVSFSELDTFLEKNEEELTVAATFGATYYRESHLSPTTLSMAQILLYRKDQDMAGEFFAMLVGNTAPEGHPVWTLRNRLERMNWQQGRNRNSHQNQAARLALLIIAWNHVRAGTAPGKLLLLPRGGLSNKNFPDPR